MSKIVQLIPAPPNLTAYYKTREGEYTSPVACIALKEDGDMALMDIDENGLIDDVEATYNFIGVKYTDK